VAGMHLANMCTQPNLDAALLQGLGGIGLGFGREGRQDSLAAIHQDDLSTAQTQVGECSLQPVMKYVAESPRHFRARGTASHDDEVQRALGDQGRIAVRTFQNGEDAGAQGLGVTQRVQRIAMLVRSRRAKEMACDPAANTRKSP